MGFGVGGTAQNGYMVRPTFGLPWPMVSHGVSYVIEGGCNPVGKEHKEIWTTFGLFWPTFGPEGQWGHFGLLLPSGVGRGPKGNTRRWMAAKPSNAVAACLFPTFGKGGRLNHHKAKKIIDTQKVQ